MGADESFDPDSYRDQQDPSTKYLKTKHT